MVIISSYDLSSALCALANPRREAQLSSVRGDESKLSCLQFRFRLPAIAQRERARAGINEYLLPVRTLGPPVISRACGDESNRGAATNAKATGTGHTGKPAPATLISGMPLHCSGSEESVTGSPSSTPFRAEPSRHQTFLGMGSSVVHAHSPKSHAPARRRRVVRHSRKLVFTRALCSLTSMLGTWSI